LLDDLHDRAGVAPSDQQLDQLSQDIQRSQRSFKELIDSFDDVAFACSLDGTLRTVNRRVTQMLGLSYQDIVGHKIDDFVQEPLRREVEGGLLRFLEKRRWSGLVRVQLKNSARALYFDCVLNAIVKGDEVVGISALARDVTEEREKERRFTELFETLQEGVYFSTPEGKLQDANPALIQMLGCDSREELLSIPTRARYWAEPQMIAAASAAGNSCCAGKTAPRQFSWIARAPYGIAPARSSATRARWWM
jgi:PAS domain S-box-containing protein